MAYLFWLINGGFAAVQHFVLRFALWRHRSTPCGMCTSWTMRRSAFCVRRIGGGYTFLHKLLLDYFADLGGDPATGVQLTKSR